MSNIEKAALNEGFWDMFNVSENLQSNYVVPRGHTYCRDCGGGGWYYNDDTRCRTCFGRGSKPHPEWKEVP